MPITNHLEASNGNRANFSTKALQKNTIAVVAGQLAAKGCLFLTTFFVARSLEANAFGEFVFVQSTIAALESVCVVGLTTAVAKSVAVRENVTQEDEQLQVATVALQIVLVTSIVVVGASALLLQYLPSGQLSDSRRLTFLVGLPATIPIALTAVLSGVLTGQQQFKRMALSQFVAALISSTMVILGAHFSSVNGAVGSLTLASILTLLITLVTIPNWKRLTRALFLVAPLAPQQQAVRREIFKTSVPVFLASLTIAPAMWVGNYSLIQQDHGPTLVGLWGASNHLVSILVFVPAAISSAMFPSLAIAGIARLGNAIAIARQAIVRMAVLSAPIFAAAFAFAQLIAASYGSSFEAGADLFRIATISALCISLHAAMSNVLTATSYAWLHAMFNVAWAAVFVGLAAVSCYVGGGAIGIAIAFAISHCIKLVLVWGFLDSLSARAVN